MLDLIRKKQKTVIIKVVFWAIIATFVGTIFLVWGKGSDTGTQPTDTAVRVNETRIPFTDFQSAYSNLYRLYQNIYRDQFNSALEKQLGLRQQALDALIDETLLLQEADRLGLKVSKQELVDSISKIPAFQENGAFSKERYLQVLAYQRLTPEAFEEMQRRQVLLDKARQTIQEKVNVEEAEVVQEYRDRNERINLAFVRLEPARFEEQVRIGPAELQAFFTEHREEFRLPEKAALRYVVFDPSRFENEVTFDEAELEKFYRRHLDRFEIPEQVKASHILVRIPADADPAQKQKKRELAQQILDQARSGADFAALAKKHSEDPGSAANGGSLGTFPRGTMVPPFEQAAFALQAGQISNLVETPFGLHIIKVESHVDAGIKPLESVLTEVRAGLRLEKAREITLEKAMDAYNIHRKDGNLEAIAKENGLALKETAFFARNEAIPGIGEAPEISAAAFLIGPGELARPVAREDGIYLAGLKDRQESRLSELAEVRPAVEQAFRQQQAGALAKAAAERILAQTKQGASLDELAKSQGLTVEETGPFSRALSKFIPRLGDVEPLAKAAFELTAGNPTAPQVFEADGSFVVVRLKEREQADLSKLDELQKSQLRESILSRKRDEAVKEQLKALREKAEIVIEPAMQTVLNEEQKP